jgi:3-hydroxyisobutyrate dehydrogenase
VRPDDIVTLDRLGVIGFIGCGRMGLPMARRLLAMGSSVHAFDVAPAALEAVTTAGAVRTASPAEAAREATIVITMLPDPPAVEGAAHGEDGVLAGLRPGALWIEMSSSTPATTRALAGAARERGAELLDAPVSGGVAGAEAGTLTIMAGGEEALLDRARPLLDELGAEIVHVGDRPGDGDAAKTINNMLSATNLAAAAEALSLGVRAGLDPERLMSCVNGGTGASNASQNKVAGHVLTGRFASRFTIGQYLKDLRIALGLAADHDVPAPVNSTACSVWTSHAARGAAGDDHTRLVDLVLRDAGLEMRWGEN